MRRLLVWVVGFFLMTNVALADGLRNFPQNVAGATFNGYLNGGMKLGARVLAMAPGLQIRDQQNLIIFASQLEGVSKLPVVVQFDAEGAVWRVWILTPQEARELNLVNIVK